jgi:hypothetical protein
MKQMMPLSLLIFLLSYPASLPDKISEMDLPHPKYLMREKIYPHNAILHERGA